MHHLKEKLTEIIKTESEFEEFKHVYNQTMENSLIKKIGNIAEQRKTNYYYDIVTNKKEIPTKLETLGAPGNPWKPNYSAAPHDHIHPQHWLKDPEKANQDKWKYLAFWDIILDEHMRQVRPQNIDDDKFKYTKDEYFASYYEDHFINNMYHEYKFTMDNEFYQKFRQDIDKYLGPEKDIEDHVFYIII